MANVPNFNTYSSGNMVKREDLANIGTDNDLFGADGNWGGLNLTK